MCQIWWSYLPHDVELADNAGDGTMCIENGYSMDPALTCRVVGLQEHVPAKTLNHLITLCNLTCTGLTQMQNTITNAW